jgi:hypothetical protein
MFPSSIRLLVVLATAGVAAAQDSTETQRAIAIVQKVDGKIVFDTKAPGKPVVGLNL